MLEHCLKALIEIGILTRKLLSFSLSDLVWLLDWGEGGALVALFVLSSHPILSPTLLSGTKSQQHGKLVSSCLVIFYD